MNDARGVFQPAFAVAFAIAYLVAVEINLALFTYHPALGKIGFGVQPPDDGPAMYWYGWVASAALAATAVACGARFVPKAAANLWKGWYWIVPVLTMFAFAWVLRGFFLR